MNILRKYKLNKYFRVPLSIEEKYIISFIENWLSELKIYTINSYDKQIFYFNKFNECVIVIDGLEKLLTNNDSKIYIRGYDFWDVIIKDVDTDNSIKIIKNFLPEELKDKEIYFLNHRTLFTHIEELYKYEHNQKT
ncbi:MAG: hypothetical protein RLZZ546_1084 [Bacteroidota bacterium]|jgi:hypothetical protein